MSGGEGKGNKGCSGAFWDGVNIKLLWIKCLYRTRRKYGDKENRCF
jgi:hypothetical protein